MEREVGLLEAGASAVSGWGWWAHNVRAEVGGAPDRSFVGKSQSTQNRLHYSMQILSLDPVIVKVHKTDQYCIMSYVTNLRLPQEIGKINYTETISTGAYECCKLAKRTHSIIIMLTSFPSTRGSHIRVACRSVCSWDQNRIKQSMIF